MPAVSVPRIAPGGAGGTAPSRGSASGGSAGERRARRLTNMIDVTFVAVLVVATVLVVAHAPTMVRVPFLLLGMLTCPGYVCLRAAGLPLGDETPALTVALSLGVTALVSTGAAMTHWWNPRLTEFGIAVISVAVLWDRRQSERATHTLLRPLEDSADEQTAADAGRPLPGLAIRAPAVLQDLLIALVPATVVVWALSIHGTSLSHLSAWGLLPRLAVAWYAGLAVVVFGCLMSHRLTGRARVVLSASYLAVLVLYLYGTAPAIEGTLRYVWVYKHLAVVQTVIATHGVHQTDIYQRWPGAFTTTAFFTTLTGHLDPTPYIRWGEPFFTVADLVMLYPLARRFTSSRGAWLACDFFAGSNWVGQQYFSPQAFSFVLTLGCLLLATSLVVGTLTWRPHLAVSAKLRIPASLSPALRAAALAPENTRLTMQFVVPALVVLDAATVVSHQLTPYIILLDIGALVVAGLLRPWWTIVVLAVLTIGFLLPNLSYIQHNFGLLSALDPFKNAATQPYGTAVRSATTSDQAHLALVLSLLIWVVGITGLVLRAGRAQTRRSVVVAAILFAAPFLTLVVQSYGGEARFRILLFSLPACSVAAAWLWERSRAAGPVRRAVASLVLLPIPVALFVPSFFGKEDLFYVPPGELAASTWLAAHMTTDGQRDVVAVLDPEYPGLQNAASVTVSGTTSTLDLATSQGFIAALRRKQPAAPAIAAAMTTYSAHGYVVFATTEAAYARDYETLGGLAAYRRIQQAVATSPSFTKVFGNSDATIFQVR